jgi:Zn-dependent peptidase ImmA (M78 family)
MKLDSIKVAGSTYKILVMDNTWHEETNKHGDCDGDKLIIRVVRNNRFKWTLWHEITHAIFHEYNLISAKGEEDIVTQIAAGWHQVYTDNPGLKRLL